MNDSHQIEKLAEGLWESLVRNPNDLEVLRLWVRCREETQGNSGALQALREAAALPRAWLASIWSTRELLAQRKLSTAMAVYRETLDWVPESSLAMQEISGHLGEAGYYQEAIDLLLHRYDPELHGPVVAFNLLNLCEDASDDVAGRRLVHRLRRMDWPQFQRFLDKYEIVFDGAITSRRQPAHLSN
jgi:hypothetical protein